MTEIFIARGYTAEETAGYIDVLPNRALIYNVEEEPSISRIYMQSLESYILKMALLWWQTYAIATPKRWPIR
jgi:hypothetical protein